MLTASRNRAAPSRQQTLRSALEWSHGLLQERERRCSGVSASSPGSASLEFIQQVLVDADDGAELDAWAVARRARHAGGPLAGGGADIERRRRAALPPARNARAPTRSSVWQTAGEQAGAAASPRAGGGRAVRCRLRGVLHRSRRRGRLAAPPRSPTSTMRATPCAGPAAPATPRWSCASARRCCARCRRRCTCERMALADACEARHPVRPSRSLAIAGMDRAQLRAGRFAEGPRPPCGRDGACLGAATGCTPGGPLRPVPRLCRAASAAAQTSDPAAGRARLDELQGLEDPAWPAQRLHLGRRGRAVARPHEPATAWTRCTAAAA